MLHSQPKSTVGTPAYIAPEVLSRREYDGKVVPINFLAPADCPHLPLLSLSNFITTNCCLQQSLIFSFNFVSCRLQMFGLVGSLYMWCWLERILLKILKIPKTSERRSRLLCLLFYFICWFPIALVYNVLTSNVSFVYTTSRGFLMSITQYHTM